MCPVTYLETATRVRAPRRPAREEPVTCAPKGTRREPVLISRLEAVISKANHRTVRGFEAKLISAPGRQGARVGGRMA